MDTETQRKWDAASRTLDLFAWGDDQRLGPHKRRLFSKIRGATLMVAAGTGNDFKFFPPSQHIIAIDISPKMLGARRRRPPHIREPSNSVYWTCVHCRLRMPASIPW